VTAGDPEPTLTVSADDLRDLAESIAATLERLATRAGRAELQARALAMEVADARHHLTTLQTGLMLLYDELERQAPTPATSPTPGAVPA
jgi:hypothetical protein